MTRSAMLEVMQEDYIRTARAKGLVKKLIINRHALKNALLPVVTLIGIELAALRATGCSKFSAFCAANPWARSASCWCW